jgi:hypothetical protein
MLEAVRIHGLPTVVYASRNHLRRVSEKQGIGSHQDLPFRPDSIYAVGNAFGRPWVAHTWTVMA